MVLEYFCENYNGVSLDCKHFRIHWFQQQAQAFVEEEYLKMDTDKMTDFLVNLYYNSECLNRVYEEVIVDKFEIDERIFFMRVTPELIFDPNVDCKFILEENNNLYFYNYSLVAITVGLRPIPDGTLAKDADLLMKKAADASVHRISVKRNLMTPMSGKSYLTNTDLCYPINGNEEKDRVTQLQQLLNVDSKTTDEFMALVSKFPPYLSSALAQKSTFLNYTMFVIKYLIVF